VITRLATWRWPGNVRELENVIERMVVLSSGDEVTPADLPEPLQAEPAQTSGMISLELPENGVSLEAVERELILKALERHGWNQSQAARFLDISRKTLIYRMEKYGLRRECDSSPELLAGTD
jgi:two-component system NtrC family response regulator